jgi:hypothetical protein
MEDLRVFMQDNSGKVIFLLGLIFLTIAVASYNMFGTVLTAVTLFIGIDMIFLGMSLHLGMFSGGLRSLTGFGMLLICVSAGLFALSLAAWQFLNIASMEVRVVPWNGRETTRTPMIIIDCYRPYLWISYLCLELGLVLFIIGVGMRIASLVRG